MELVHVTAVENKKQLSWMSVGDWNESEEKFKNSCYFLFYSGFKSIHIPSWIYIFTPPTKLFLGNIFK